MALTGEACREAGDIHEAALAGKHYYFVSDRKHAGGRKWVCSDPLDGKACTTVFYEVREGREYFLYRAEISRGRKHQVRRHAAQSGTPILGDTEYGGAPFPRLCLHCGEVDWPGLEKNVSAHLPQSFEMLLKSGESLALEARLAYERRLGWLQTITDAFRIIHRKELGGRDFSVDLFGRWLSVTGYDEKMTSEALKELLENLFPFWKEHYNFRGGIIRHGRKDPHRRKLFSDVVTFGEPSPATFLVKEHDLAYAVTLNDSQHAGLFPDQRDSRKRILAAAKGRRVANLFSFTCSFSSISVSAEAEVVFSVDLAAGALERGKGNFAINGLDESGRGKFIREDVLKWLARQVRKKKNDPVCFKPWDLIVCDPPVFASSGRRKTFSVEKEWPLLAKSIRFILSEKGIALFANNHRGGNEIYYSAMLEKEFKRVTRFCPPFDFPDLPGCSPHVRIYWCEV